MSEEIKPVVTEEPADVVKVEQETPVVNYAEKNLAELTELFQQLTESEDRMKRSKEADTSACPRRRQRPAKTLPFRSRTTTPP